MCDVTEGYSFLMVNNGMNDGLLMMNYLRLMTLYISISVVGNFSLCLGEIPHLGHQFVGNQW